MIDWSLIGLLFCVSMLTAIPLCLFFYRMGRRHGKELAVTRTIVERNNPYVR